MSKKIGFMILGYKQIKCTIACIDSVLEHEPNSEVFFLENGSQDGSLQQLQDRYQAEPSFHLFTSPYNRGIAAGRNLLRSELLQSNFAPQTIILLDNDACLGESVSAQLQSLFVDKAVGAIGPTGYLFDADFTFFQVEAPAEVDALAAYFLAIRLDAFLAAGPFDRIFEKFLYGGEDVDFCLSIKKAGYKVLSLPSLPIVHRGRASSALLGEAFEEHNAATNKLFIDKWKSDRRVLEVDLNSYKVRQLSERGYLRGDKPFQFRD